MLTATIENAIGARRRRTSRIWISAQLSLPPERPTMTRSPSSIRLKSAIALPTFRAIFVSISDALAMSRVRRAPRPVLSGLRLYYARPHGFGPCEARGGREDGGPP